MLKAWLIEGVPREPLKYFLDHYSDTCFACLIHVSKKEIHVHTHVFPFTVKSMSCFLKFGSYVIPQHPAHHSTPMTALLAKDVPHRPFGPETSQTMHLSHAHLHCNSAQALPAPSPSQRSA